jgi:hypothetical protein
VGCHDGRRGTVPVVPERTALRRPASRPRPWYGPPRTFNYLAEVQPVFDRHCVECHDYGKESGEKLNLAGDLLMNFNTSYAELRGKRYVRVVGAGPYRVQMPGSWGSHASPLVRVLLEGHGDAEIDRQVRLERDEFDRIVTWIDINAPYYPEYASAYRKNRYGRSPLDRDETRRLGELVGRNLDDQKAVDQVNLTRPELSPCLAALPDKNGPEYREALSIIRRGTERLAQVPRADMPGFKLVDPVEIVQQAKYEARLAEETAMRRAVVEGRREYDGGPGGGQ